MTDGLPSGNLHRVPRLSKHAEVTSWARLSVARPGLPAEGSGMSAGTAIPAASPGALSLAPGLTQPGCCGAVRLPSLFNEIKLILERQNH